MNQQRSQKRLKFKLYLQKVDELKAEEEPVVAEDGGMKEARELFMKDSNVEEKKTEAYIKLKQDKEEKKSV